VLVITADVHERASRVPELLKNLGVTVELRSLTRGDYRIGDQTLVERKTVDDLHSSIVRGRFWAQIPKIRTARWPYLFVEGRTVFSGPIQANSIRGICLAVTDLGVTIIRTDDAYDSAKWLIRIASRRLDGVTRNRPIYSHRPKSTAAPPAEAALACAQGVSVETARTILGRFGSLQRVGEASIDDLRALPGVGVKRATAIVALIHDEWSL
jgi:DNA excision repair protein ERCC-4